MIVRVRDQPVILDSDLARVYGVTTKALNQAVKRNAERFPEDFAFQLQENEAVALRSQIVTSNANAPDPESNIRPQTATGSRGGRRTLPWAFTEHGALMAANILRSPQAVQMSVFLVRAFVRLREQFAANDAILRRLAEIDEKLLAHDEALVLVWQKLQSVLRLPPPTPPPAPKRRIGFHT